ncbi:MAG: DNA polymerase III subunit chi [Pseudomonadota bacterium]
MTRIDFHTNVPDKLAYACRLARKAYGARASLIMLAEDAAQARALDAALWTFSERDFLPHVMAHDPLAERTPIIVCSEEPDPQASHLAHCTLLVNLSTRAPRDPGRYERVVEIVSSDAADAACGRQRYSAYKQQCFPLTHFVAGTS